MAGLPGFFFMKELVLFHCHGLPKGNELTMNSATVLNWSLDSPDDSAACATSAQTRLAHHPFTQWAFRQQLHHPRWVGTPRWGTDLILRCCWAWRALELPSRNDETMWSPKLLVTAVVHFGSLALWGCRMWVSVAALMLTDHSVSPSASHRCKGRRNLHGSVSWYERVHDVTPATITKRTLVVRKAMAKS